MHLDSMWFLAAQVADAQPAYCVELGSFLGRSSYAICTALAALAPTHGERRLLCVDIWTCPAGSEFTAFPWAAEMLSWFDPSVGEEYFGHDRFTNTFDAFRYTLSRFPEMRSRIDVRRTDSSTVDLRSLPMVDFAHIDAGHDEESVRADFANLQPRLSPRATVVFDDYLEKFPGVVRFVDELVAQGTIEPKAQHRGLFAATLT